MAAILSALSWLFRFSLWEKVVDFFLKKVTFGAMLAVNLALMGFFVSYMYCKACYYCFKVYRCMECFFGCLFDFLPYSFADFVYLFRQARSNCF